MPQLELSPHDLAQLRGLLALHVPTATVWAYGSRVRGGAHACSDLDLVLRDEADLQRPCNGLANLRLALQDSRLPMLVDLHDWAYLSPSMRAEISAAYVEIQTARCSST